MIKLALCLVAALIGANSAYATGTGSASRRVFNLRNSNGNFESSPAGQRRGWRSVGFWSGDQPRVGDLVVKRGNNGASHTVWEIESVQSDFTGSNGDQFWRGVMRDLVYTKTLNKSHTDALNEAAKTDPDVLPPH
jgi:hypothetical protein